MHIVKNIDSLIQPNNVQPGRMALRLAHVLYQRRCEPVPLLLGEQFGHCLLRWGCLLLIRGKKFKYPIGRHFWWFRCEFFQILRE